MRRRIALCLLGLLVGQGVLAEPGRPVAGRSVVEVLAERSSASLRFIYSSQLLPPTLRVLQEPAAAAALAQVKEILAAHGLALVSVAPGIYAVAAASPATLTPVTVAAGTDQTQPAAAAAGSEMPAFEMLITGERYPYGLKRTDDSVVYSVTRLGTRPTLGEDALYALSRQPGLSQGDLSGRLNIRGGGANETLILMDGFPIREAYHMPGYRSVLSVIDPDVLSEISLYSGAIPARYGDRMSGVLEMRSVREGEVSPNSLGAGFLNARARTDLVLDRAGDDLLLDVRYGKTGYLLQALQPAVSNPRYGDLFARLRVAAGERTEFTLNALFSRDKLSVERNGLQESSTLSSNLGYFWLNSTTTLFLPGEDEARLSTWLGNSNIDTQRLGQLNSPDFASGHLSERRRADIWDLITELQWPWREQHVLEAGASLSRGKARYLYDSAVQFLPGIAGPLGVADSNSQNFDLHPQRLWGSLHLADSWAILPDLTAQAGLRVSHYETPDAGDLTNWDPRVSLAYQAGSRSTLRAAWGRVHQISDLSEIVPGRDPNRRLVNQQSEYFVLGYDHAFGHAMLLRIEAFQKDQLHLLALQRNLLLTPSILPELSLDRVWVAPHAARMRGLEFNLQQSAADWHWNLAYALSRASETSPQGTVARSGDQRHAASFSVDWTRGAWLASSALNFRSGLPTTQFATNASGGVVIGRRNADRLPGALGLDLRLKWRHQLPASRLTATAQVSNLFGGTGNCCSELAPQGGATPQVVLRRDGSLPPVPWAGISWEF